VIPAHNAAATIEDTMHSVLAQSWRSLELIVVDDGSTDTTAEVVGSLGAADPRVILLRQKQAGPAAARNRAIRHAAGEFVSPIDADDLWHPAKLEHQMKAVAAAPEAGLVYCLARRIDERGFVTGLIDGALASGCAFNRYVYSNFITGSSPLIRRSLLLAVGGYEESLQRLEVYLTQLRLLAKGPFEAVPLFLVGYRASPGSLSSNRDAMFKSWLTVRQMLRREFPQIDRTTLQWAHGRRSLQFAEHLVYRGCYAAAVPHLLQALWYDPRRSIVYAGNRINRFAMKRFKPLYPIDARLHFRDADPFAGTDSPLVSDGAGPSLFTRIEAARFERLGHLDAATRCKL
jgi:glycosyltransferase involved in cell wall biosynthesis